MQNALETAARIAEAAGANVTALALPPIMEDAFAAQFTIQDYENFRSLAFEFDRHRDLALPASFLIDAGGDIVKVYQGPINPAILEQDYRNIPQATLAAVVSADEKKLTGDLSAIQFIYRTFVARLKSTLAGG